MSEEYVLFSVKIRKEVLENWKNTIRKNSRSPIRERTEEALIDNTKKHK